MKLLNFKPTALAAQQVIAARPKRTANPLAAFPFFKAFLQYDGDNPDRYFTASWAAWAVGNAGLKHTLARAIYGPEFTLREGAFNMDKTEQQLEDFFDKEATSLLTASRLRREGDRIIVGIPTGRALFSNLFYPDANRTFTQGYLPKTHQVVQDFVNRVRTSKFRALLTTDKALDITIGLDKILEYVPPADYERRTAALNAPEYPKLLSRVAGRMRFLRAPLNELVNETIRNSSIGGTLGARIPYEELSVEHEGFRASPEVAAQALDLMLGTYPVFGYLECEFDNEFVQALTGQSASDVPLSMIGNWLSSTFDHQWGVSDDSMGDIDRVSSLKAARDESAASSALPFDPASGSPDRLCVDNTGQFLYLPDVDAVEEYENELETVYTTEGGEWVISDTTNPHNVIRITDAQGRVRNVPRKMQANRVLFTDFRVGRLAYSTSHGTLGLFDISSMRPMTNAHVADALKLPMLIESAMSENFCRILNSAVRSATERFPDLNQEMPHDPQGPLGDLGAAMMNGKWVDFTGGRRGSLQEYLLELAGLYHQLPNVDAEILDAFRDLRFYHLSPTSPIPELRIVYKLVAAYRDYVYSNFELVSAEAAVVPALARLGWVTVIAKFAHRFPEVREAAAEEEAAYNDPVEDYRTVEIPEIPYTRGIELMPHQVKIFAKLKKFPRRFTLDVAAGGGKTFTAVLVAAMYMKHRGVRRPLVVCPNILLKNYMEDAAYATSGGLNIVAINADILSSSRWGAERLKELLDKAPINTVVVASFDSMSKGTRRVYATTSFSVNPVTEFLSQFDFDFVVSDESHKIKNVNSQTNRNVARIAARAAYSGIMTGTLIFDTPKDVVGQFNIMDPTIFGSNSHFDETFMETSSSGVRIARLGAPRVVKDRIKSKTGYVQITRKEWASLLPPRRDEVTGEDTEVFHILNTGRNDTINFTEAQQAYYDLLLDKVRQKIMEVAETDKSLQAVLRAMQAGELDNADEDDELMEQMMNKLNPYLARLEIYLSNPVNSREVEFTQRLSSVEDRVSPKAKKVAQICRRHLERGYVGKILVFTQYNESAEGIFNSLPDDLKGLAVHYSATNKTSLLKFQSDPRKMILIGNERSIGTGLNLQMASRIIRCESTWNWGALEQAESRVNRPVPKSKELRKAMYLDWIVVNNTIDVTKIARMISKAVESYKFNGAGNPMFDDMEALEPIRMSMENVLTRNDLYDGETGALKHFETYQLCRQLEEAEFETFRNDPTIRTEGYKLFGGPLPNSGLLKNVPYVPGMAMYGTAELGLVPFVEYVTNTKHSTLQQFDPVDLIIHTESGDGRCTGANRSGSGDLSSVTVELPDGSRSTYELSTVFVVTRAGVDIDTRRQLAEIVMTEHLQRPVTIEPEAPLTVEEPEVEEPDEDPTPNRGRMKILRTRPVPNMDRQANKAYAMYSMSVGHAYTLVCDTEDPDVPVDALKAAGFETVRPYWSARVRKPEVLEQWYTKASRHTQFTRESSAQIEEIIELMKAHKPKTFYQNVTPEVLRTFWRDQQRAGRAGQTTAFISIEDNGESSFPFIYLVAFVHQNPQFRDLINKSRTPTVEWDRQLTEQLWYTARSQKDAIAKATQVNRTNPIKNFNKLVERLRQLRPTPTR